jgi:predicted nucleic acid-binding protein
MSNLPNVTVTVLDAALASRAVSLAAQHGLRGADAVYAAVAAQAGSTLVTLDSEQLTRLSGVIVTQTPSAALAGLVPPSRS